MEKYLLLLISLIMIGNAHASRFVGVCTWYAPSGHEQKTKATKAFFDRIGVGATRSREAISIYVEWFPKERESPEGYYYHSNYIKGSGGYPVKVVGNLSNVRHAFENIIYDSRHEANQNEKLTNRFLKGSTFYVHKNVFLSPKLIMLEGIEKIYIVNDRGIKRRVEKKRREKRCVLEIEDPCKDHWGSMSYISCTSNLGEWDLDGIAKGLVEALGSAFDCRVSVESVFSE